MSIPSDLKVDPEKTRPKNPSILDLTPVPFSCSIGVSQEHPNALYGAYMLLAHETALGADLNGSVRELAWGNQVRQGIELVEWVLDRIASEGVSLPEVDAFACASLFRARDRGVVREDLNRYRRHLEDPRKCARSFMMRLPSQFGGSMEVPSLLIRDVQNPGDPERCLFFKDWARTDRQNAPGGQGYVALSVFISDAESQTGRCILSVKADSGASLRGLAECIEQLESARRKEIFGVDNRVQDPKTGVLMAVRPGFSNSDPWYDGRSHHYTIVDSPRTGTILTADEIEEVFLRFGKSTVGSEPLDLRKQSYATNGGDRHLQALGRLTYLAETWKRFRPATRGRAPEVFISYSRRTLEWVEQSIFQPLVKERGADKIYFDRHNLIGGVNQGQRTKIARVFRRSTTSRARKHCKSCNDVTNGSFSPVKACVF